jgi:hypothetical protein
MGEGSGQRSWRSDRELREVMGRGEAPRRRRGQWIVDMTPRAIRFDESESQWRVKAQSRPGEYAVDIERHTCSCPDHTENKQKCKHQFAVEMLLAKQNQRFPGGLPIMNNLFISYLLEQIDLDVPWMAGRRVRLTSALDLFEVIDNGRRVSGSIKKARTDDFMGLALVLDEQKDGYFLVDADAQKSRCKLCNVRIPNSAELANSKGIYDCWPCWKSRLNPSERAAYVDLPRREHPRICDEQIVEAMQERMQGEIPRLQKMVLGGRYIYPIEASAAWTRELRRRQKASASSSIVCQGDHPLDL